MALTEREIIAKLRDSFRLCGERCEAIARWGAVGARWMEMSGAIDEIEGALRQLAHWRGDTRYLNLVPVYVRTKEVGRLLYLSMRWAEFRKYGIIFAQGLAQVERLAERPTGQSGPILPTLPDPPRENVH